MNWFYPCIRVEPTIHKSVMTGMLIDKKQSANLPCPSFIPANANHGFRYGLPILKVSSLCVQTDC